MRRPKPIEYKHTRATAIRGPDEAGRWYWRARTKGQRATVWTGWARTRAEVVVEVRHPLYMRIRAGSRGL